MTTERLRLTLWMSVVFNFGVALIALMPKTAVGQFFGLPSDLDPVFMVMTAWFIFVFGLAYAWIARQEEINKPLLMMGIVGKTGVFVLAVILLIRGDMNVPLFLAPCTDLVFASLWFWWWRTH